MKKKIDVTGNGIDDIDYDNDNTTSWNLDVEAGKMITRNQSIYLRPGTGIGGHRFFDWNLEIGWKQVW